MAKPISIRHFPSVVVTPESSLILFLKCSLGKFYFLEILRIYLFYIFLEISEI